MSPSSPFGRRLLPHVVNRLAAEQPDRTWIQLSIEDDDIPRGYKTYSYATLANAVNSLVHQFESELGRSDSFDMIAYFALNDVCYIIIVLAAIKIGHVALLSSRRNSIEAHINLLEKTQCKALVHADSHKDLVASLQKIKQIKTLNLVSQDHLLHSSSVEKCPYERGFDQGTFDPLVILRTSASTRLPKPITVRAGSLTITDAYHDLADFHDRPNFLKYIAQEASSLFIPMPLFHIAGLSLTLSLSIYYQRQICYPAPSKPMDASIIMKCLTASQVDATHDQVMRSFFKSLFQGNCSLLLQLVVPVDWKDLMMKGNVSWFAIILGGYW